jgi:adenylate cyclase
MLRIKALTDTVQAQSTKLAEWNAKLEERVNEQLGQLEKLSQLKRFFSSQLAEAILTGGADNPLVSHRREVTVVFLDLRNFTAFAETLSAVSGHSRGAYGRMLAVDDAHQKNAAA